MFTENYVYILTSTLKFAYLLVKNTSRVAVKACDLATISLAIELIRKGQTCIHNM